MINIKKLEIDISKALVDDISKNIGDEFTQHKSPKEKRWSKTKDNKEFDSRDSIKHSINIKRSGNEISITSSKPYTGYLNYGTQYMKPREIYPENYFPKSWRNIEDTIDKIIEDELK